MSMPQGGGSGQPWETGPQAGAQGQASAPGPSNAGEQGRMPGAPQGQQYGSPPQGGVPGQFGGSPQGLPISPVNELETRVTGRRIVQFIIDDVIVGVIWSLLFWALDRGTGVANALLELLAAVVAVAWAFFYWAYRPFTANGQTFGMQLMGIRVIAKNGGPASLGQFVIRAILLIVDELPFLFLVGYITVLCSRYRQRVGDHAANTLVVSASVEPIPAQQEFAGAGQAGSR